MKARSVRQGKVRKCEPKTNRGKECSWQRQAIHREGVTRRASLSGALMESGGTKGHGRNGSEGTFSRAAQPHALSAKTRAALQDSPARGSPPPHLTTVPPAVTCACVHCTADGWQQPFPGAAVTLLSGGFPKGGSAGQGRKQIARTHRSRAAVHVQETSHPLGLLLPVSQNSSPSSSPPSPP